MKAISQSVMLAAICGLCGCGSVSDGPSNDRAPADEGPLGQETSRLAPLSSGIAQGYRGDFDGDGIEDIIMVNSSGSYEYLGKATGGFSTSKWTRNDLPLDAVNYTVGDFNKDGFSDLIIATSSGSYLYTGKTGGGFNSGAWQRYDLPLGSVAYHAGDFNGDNTSDVLITTASGTYLYLGVAGGTLADSGWSAYWPLGSYDFLVGDFNNDTRSDFILLTTSGSQEYLGVIGGSFYQAAWAGGSAFVLNQCKLFTGDFNGDRSWDLLAQNGSAAYELHGNSGIAGGFTGSVWSNVDYQTINHVNFTPGEFNGDGKWDVIISTGTTSYLYLGRANGLGITLSTWQAPLSSYDTAFFPGNFTGGPGNNNHPADVIVTARSTGTDEYLGQTGTTTGGFTTGAWVHPGLTLEGTAFF